MLSSLSMKDDPLKVQTMNMGGESQLQRRKWKGKKLIKWIQTLERKWVWVVLVNPNLTHFYMGQKNLTRDRPIFYAGQVRVGLVGWAKICHPYSCSSIMTFSSYFSASWQIWFFFNVYLFRLCSHSHLLYTNLQNSMLARFYDREFACFWSKLDLGSGTCSC